MNRLVAMTAGSMLIGAAVLTSAAQNAFPVIPPVRRAPEGRPATLPVLSAAAEQVGALTLSVRFRRQAAGRTDTWRQTIRRTANRVHVAGTDGREWLFERNVIDPRRVSGSLVEHYSHTIVVYEESDLRHALGISGWANVLALGIDPDWLERLVPTGAKRTIGGIQAARYAPIDRPGDPSEVWWAADQHLPIAFTIANGAEMTRMSVERVEVGTDPNRLRPPAVQSPSYAVVQFADWLEHH